jgi:hypothetical protein
MRPGLDDDVVDDDDDDDDDDDNDNDHDFCSVTGIWPGGIRSLGPTRRM